MYMIWILTYIYPEIHNTISPKSVRILINCYKKNIKDLYFTAILPYETKIINSFSYEIFFRGFHVFGNNFVKLSYHL